MKVMLELGRYAPDKVLYSVIFSVIAGVCYAVLVPLVLFSINELSGSHKGDPQWLFDFLKNDGIGFSGTFFLLCFLILILRSASQILLVKTTTALTSNLRLKLYNKISASPIDSLESVGYPKLISIMTRDIGLIVEGARCIPVILVGMVTILGVLSYVLMINIILFIFGVAALIVGVLIYQLPILLARKYYAILGELTDRLHESFRGLIFGAKELKLDSNKRSKFSKNELLPVEEKICGANLMANTIDSLVLSYADLLCFFVIGIMVYVFGHYYQVGAAQLLAAVMILLYISAPIASVLSMIPSVFRANMAYDRLDALFFDMRSEEFDHHEPGVYETWTQLRLKNVVYSYSRSNKFIVGPINLTVNRGELTFIVGGNGSGKSTLSKLITQHYIPQSGDIYFDSEKVSTENINKFRQCISCIYSDYHLFGNIYGYTGTHSNLKNEVDNLLDMFYLKEKVSFNENGFSTLSLSDGQRRRLALISAIVENKDLYVFDEWAADQDPIFREIFYLNILPTLKKQGKAVIVISHDDRYFSVADKLIKLESGQIVS